MADRPQMPAPPDGCVYGPWLATQGDCWAALINDETDDLFGITFWEIGYWSEPEYGLETICISEELLRLANELEQAKARIKELEGEVNCQEERIQSLERSLRIAKDEQQSCNQAFANLLQIPFYSWQRNWQAVARLVLALPADADVETINLALILRDQGGQDA